MAKGCCEGYDTMVRVVDRARIEGRALGLSEDEIAARCEGASFREFMRQMGLTRERLCRALGLTEAGVALLESGRSSLTPAMAQRLSRAEGINIIVHPLDEGGLR